MGRAPCCDKNGLNKGPWMPEEDRRLLDYIQEHGPGSWRTLPKNAGLSRCGKSCRLRWTNYLRPDIKRGRFSFEEEQTIIQLHSILGNKWSAIAARLPGRTDNEIKNYWNTHIRKRLLGMGIDPGTHTPRLDLLDLSSLLDHSRLGNPRLLGVEPVVNTELLRIATGLLSAQRRNAELLHQNSLQEQSQPQQQQLSSSQTQEEYTEPSFLPQQQQTLVQEFPCAQLMPANLEQLPSSAAQPNLWSNNGMPWDSLQSFSTPPTDSVGLYAPAPSMDPPTGAPIFNPNIRRSFDLHSVLPTPASSSDHPLSYSSSSYVNSITNTTTAMEDEKDSYCSSVLDFPLPDLLDVGGGFL